MRSTAEGMPPPGNAGGGVPAEIPSADRTRKADLIKFATVLAKRRPPYAVRGNVARSARQQCGAARGASKGPRDNGITAARTKRTPRGFGEAKNKKNPVAAKAEHRSNRR